MPQDTAVAAGAVKAVVNIMRTVRLSGRDLATASLAEMSAADSQARHHCAAQGTGGFRHPEQVSSSP